MVYRPKRTTVILVCMLLFSALFVAAASQDSSNSHMLKNASWGSATTKEPNLPIAPMGESEREIEKNEKDIGETLADMEHGIPHGEEAVHEQPTAGYSQPRTTSPPGPGLAVAGPPPDTIPPDALIHWDSATKDIVVTGIDNQDTTVDITQTVLAQKTHKTRMRYTLQDDADNTFNLTLAYTVRDENRGVRILRMEYNGVTETKSEIHYFVNFKTDKNGQLSHVHQNIHVDGNFKLNSHFRAKTHKTNYRLDATRIGREYTGAQTGLYVFDILTSGDVTLSGAHPPEPGIIQNPLLGNSLVDWSAIINYQPPEHHSYEPPGFFDTSEYMMGRVAVAVILLESNGNIDPNTENWTTSERNNVRNEIQGSTNWWVNRFNAQGYNLPASQNLNFVYDWTRQTNPVPTAYEPITRQGSISQPGSGHFLWATEANTALGYTNFTNALDNTRQYLNDLRNSTGADWAFAVFVVDSSADADGRFSDSSCAYAYLGGPFVVMTYNNDNYNWMNMDAVGAHEIGHIFYALDEYPGASFATARSGYLNIVNSNHAVGGTLNATCIMKGVQFSVVPNFSNNDICVPTREMIGWRDTDTDNKPDILDTFPSLMVQRTSPNPTTGGTVTYTGRAEVNPFTNNNPLDVGRNITLNIISRVEYRMHLVGGPWGGWILATASDGFFDGPEENFTTTVPLARGTYEIEIRAVNSVGNMNTTTDSVTSLLSAITNVNDKRVSDEGGADSINPAVAVAGRKIYTVWSDKRNTAFEIYLNRSSTNGILWQASDTLLSSNDGWNSFAPTIGVFHFPNGQDYVHVVWADVTSPTLFWAGSDTSGFSWTAPQGLTNVPGAASSPDLMVQGLVLNLVYRVTDTSNTYYYYQRGSFNLVPFAVTWNTPKLLATYSHHFTGNPQIAVNGSNIHVVWDVWDFGSSSNEVEYVMSPDAGVNFYNRPGGTPGAVNRLSSSGFRSMSPDISVNGSYIHVVWTDEKDGNFEIYYLRSTDDGATWNPEKRITNDSQPSVSPAIFASSAGVHIVWSNSTTIFNSDIRYILSKNDGMTFAQEQNVTQAQYSSTAPRIVIDGDWAHIVWKDIRNGSTDEIYYKSFKWNFLA